MSRIDRHLRHVAVAIVSALLIACGSDGATAPRQDPQVPPADTLPAPMPAPSSVVGSWVTQRLDGKALPASIAGGTEPNGLTWDVTVVHDTLIITADGRWVQHVRTRQTQSDGFDFSAFWGDKGIWTRQGDTVHFDSDWIQNVAFDAQLQADGTLVVMHDFTLDDEIPVMRREMKR